MFECPTFFIYQQTIEICSIHVDYCIIGSGASKGVTHRTYTAIHTSVENFFFFFSLKTNLPVQEQGHIIVRDEI